jgi:DNA-binding winged helix-turn-helix (wHTH) protein
MYHCGEDSKDPRNNLDAVTKKEILPSVWNRTPVVQPVASQFTDLSRRTLLRRHSSDSFIGTIRVEGIDERMKVHRHAFCELTMRDLQSIKFPLR